MEYSCRTPLGTDWAVGVASARRDAGPAVDFRVVVFGPKDAGGATVLSLLPYIEQEAFAKKSFATKSFAKDDRAAPFEISDPDHVVVRSFQALPELDANGNGILTLDGSPLRLLAGRDGFEFAGPTPAGFVRGSARALGPKLKLAKVARKAKGRFVTTLRGDPLVDADGPAPDAVGAFTLDGKGHVTSGGLTVFGKEQVDVEVRGGAYRILPEGFGLLVLRGGRPDTTDDDVLGVHVFVPDASGAPAFSAGYVSALDAAPGGRYLPVRGLHRR